MDIVMIVLMVDTLRYYYDYQEDIHGEFSRVVTIS